MKKMMLSLVLVTAVLTPSAFAADSVKVEWDGETHTFRVEDVREVAVCSFKKTVADKLGLKVSGFDLRRSRLLIPTGKSLQDAGVYSGKTLTINLTASFQCR